MAAATPHFLQESGVRFSPALSCTGFTKSKRAKTGSHLTEFMAEYCIAEWRFLLAWVKTTSQFCCWNSELHRHSLLVYWAWLVPRTLARLYSNLYVGQPQPEKPYLFHETHGDAQVWGCIPTTLIILPFHKLLLSLVTTTKNAGFQSDCLPNQINHTDKTVPVPIQNRAHWTSKCETILAGKIHFSEEMTGFMTTKL